MKDGSTVVVEGVKRTIEDVINRKKLKQSFEYECAFKGMSSSENIWLPRDDLIKRGFEKKVRRRPSLSFRTLLTLSYRSWRSTRARPRRPVSSVLSSDERLSSTWPTLDSSPSLSLTTRCAVSLEDRRSRSSSPPQHGVVLTCVPLFFFVVESELTLVPHAGRHSRRAYQLPRSRVSRGPHRGTQVIRRRSSCHRSCLSLSSPRSFADSTRRRTTASSPRAFAQRSGR